MADGRTLPVQLSADSRDNHLTLRRVARQQRIVELLARARRPVPSSALALELGVGRRTVERDLARLREAGVPIQAVRGVNGGNLLPASAAPRPVELSVDEVAAVIASLVALGPTETDSASSAMRALVRAIRAPGAQGADDDA